MALESLCMHPAEFCYQEGKGGCIDGVDELADQQGLDRGLGMLGGLGERTKERLAEASDLGVAHHRAHVLERALARLADLLTREMRSFIERRNQTYKEKQGKVISAKEREGGRDQVTI